jgi:hypothetical protein
MHQDDGDAACQLEHFPIVLTQRTRSKNALALCFGEHLYPTGDPFWSDDAPALCFGKHLYPTGDPFWSIDAL